MVYMHWVLTGQTVNKEYYVEVLRDFSKRFRRKRPALFKSAQRHFYQDNAPVHNSIVVTDYLTKMGIKTVPQPPYSQDLAPCDFCLFAKLKEKLRGCRYETIEEMKEAVMKVIDTLTQEDFHMAFQKLLERYNKCIEAGGDYFVGDKSFMCVLSIKVPIRKKSLETYLMILVTLYDLDEESLLLILTIFEPASGVLDMILNCIQLNIGWFGFFVQWYINLCRLFNAKAILLEEQ